MDQPTKVAFGAFGNIASNFLESADMVSMIHTGMPDWTAEEKYTRSAQLLLMGVLPVFNDNVKAYMGYQTGIWYSAGNEAIPMRATMNAILARGLVGARTREELSYYRMQNNIWEQESDYRNVVDGNKKFLTTTVSLWRDGVLTTEGAKERIAALVNLYEEWPESVRLQMLRDSMEVQQNDAQGDTIYKQIIDALKDRRFDTTALLPVIDDFKDIPQDKRDQVKQLIIDAHESRVNVDATALETLQESTNGN
jgi:hypothetical protein